MRSFYKRKKFLDLKRSRLCSTVFEQYQKSRVQFVQTVATLSTRPQNIEILQSVGKKQFRVRAACMSWLWFGLLFVIQRYFLQV